MSVKVTIPIPVWLDRLCACPILLYRKWKYGYSFRRIYLGEGEYTIVDPEDYCRLKKFNWYLSGTDKKFYAHCNVKIENTETKTMSMHRMMTNAPDGLLVDHRNGDSLDNRKTNLRLATRAQNMHNSRKRKNTSSQYKGVCFYKRRRKWAAYINVARKRIYLGYFDLESEAARAYDVAAKIYHKEFARLNFPDDKLDKTRDCVNLGTL
jgi:hypothetical protein